MLHLDLRSSGEQMTDQIDGDIAYRGNIAVGYDEARMSEPLWDIEQLFVKELVTSIPPISIVLDIPFGTGRFSDMYHQKDFFVIGSDISMDMLKVACSKITSKVTNIELLRTDACHLPLTDSSVDIVICFRLVHLLPPNTLYTVLSQLKRVTKNRIVVEVAAVDMGFPFNIRMRFRSLFRLIARIMRRTSSLNSESWANIKSYVHSVRSLRQCFSSIGLIEARAIRIADYSGWPVMVFYLDKRATS